jgi:hypothetical protein
MKRTQQLKKINKIISIETEAKKEQKIGDIEYNTLSIG